MQVTRYDVDEIDELFYEGRKVRTVTLDNGTVLFLAKDIATTVLGVVNSFNLTKAVDNRCKAELVLSFEEDVNPQRYIFVTLDGLMSIVYRARKSDVNRFDFITWAKERA